MERSKFPEKVPFRLTRMLVNAMEVCRGEAGKVLVICFCVISFVESFLDAVII